MVVSESINSPGSVSIGGRVAALLELGMGFHPDFTGRQNAVMAAQLLGLQAHDIERLMPDIEAFSEIGDYMDQPVRVYSSGMQMRLAFAMTLAINFECFLIDEVMAVGDHRFHQKCYDALFVTRKDCAMIMISHDTNIIRRYCNQALVLKNGRGRVFSNLDLAIKIYQTLQ